MGADQQKAWIRSHDSKYLEDQTAEGMGNYSSIYRGTSITGEFSIDYWNRPVSWGELQEISKEALGARLTLFIGNYPAARGDQLRVPISPTYLILPFS